MADRAAHPAAVAAGEVRGELARYRADYLAATAPVGPCLLAGAVAALGVYAFPILVVSLSSVLPRLAYAVVFPVSRAVVRLVRPGAPEGAAVPPPTPPAGPAPTGVPGGVPPGALPTPGVEGTAEVAAAVDPAWLPVALLLFWPVALLVTGTAVAALHRWRLAAVRDQLERYPVELSILPEALLFYALTAGAALLVRLDSFVALGANAAFAWLGYVIWRWLFDRLLPRLTPTPLREAAALRAAAEGDLRRRQREAG